MSRRGRPLLPGYLGDPEGLLQWGMTLHSVSGSVLDQEPGPRVQAPGWTEGGGGLKGPCLSFQAPAS